jgi:hypothetical protein
MNDGSLRLESILAESNGTPARRLVLFALLGLGIVESLANGLVSANEALRLFFNAENCLFVRKRLKEKTADQVMSRGVQLPDLFDILPADEAQRQFQHELSTMRALCLKLLEGTRQAA